MKKVAALICMKSLLDDFPKKIIIIIDIVSFSGYLCCLITVALWWIFRCYIVVKRETNPRRSIRKRYLKQIAKFISVLPCGMKTESKWSKFWYLYLGIQNAFFYLKLFWQLKTMLKNKVIMFFVYEYFLPLRTHSETNNNFLSLIKGWYLAYSHCSVLRFPIKGWTTTSFSMNTARTFFITTRKTTIHLKVFTIWWIANFRVIHLKITLYMFREFRKDQQFMEIENEKLPHSCKFLKAIVKWRIF